MDGFKRPAPPPDEGASRTPIPLVAEQQAAQDTLNQTLPPVDISLTPSALQNTKTSLRRKKRWPMAVGLLLGVLFMIGVGFYFWYQTQLGPADEKDTAVRRVEIPDGSSLSTTSTLLKERGVIRSSVAFSIFASLEGKKDAIKAGTCNLAPSESAQEILTKISKGCHDFTSVTFYPGATIEPSLYAKTKAEVSNKEFRDPSIRASLMAAGFTSAQINAALAANYDSPLFAGKPAGEGYEGYIFGETYYVDVSATASQVLQSAFDHFSSIVKDNDLVAKFQAQGLNLYQGITLASVVEKELDCEGKPTEERKNRCYTYQQQIAKVFLNRLARGMSLGSDVTSIYASDRLGVTPSIGVDSPYNTRKYPGLPPGPIATPGELALRSVANPADTDALYFLAGDDGLIYFATDEAGHNANIKNHCQQLCGEL